MRSLVHRWDFSSSHSVTCENFPVPMCKMWEFYNLPRIKYDNFLAQGVTYVNF